MLVYSPPESVNYFWFGVDIFNQHENGKYINDLRMFRNTQNNLRDVLLHQISQNIFTTLHNTYRSGILYQKVTIFFDF